VCKEIPVILVKMVVDRKEYSEKGGPRRRRSDRRGK
jgi:hypothetical protein